MLELMKILLQDLGLYDSIPNSFPELIVWVTTFTVAATVLGCVIKTFFWAVSNIGKVGGKW